MCEQCMHFQVTYSPPCTLPAPTGPPRFTLTLSQLSHLHLSIPLSFFSYGLPSPILLNLISSFPYIILHDFPAFTSPLPSPHLAVSAHCSSFTCLYPPNIYQLLPHPSLSSPYIDHQNYQAELLANIRTEALIYSTH